MSDWSRHSRYSRSHTPRRKRVLPLWGAYEDTGKYFRCWNCDHICNIDRDGHDNGETGSSGVAVKDFAEISNPTYGFEDDLEVICNLDDGVLVASKNGPDGSVLPAYRHDHYPTVNVGCPFCGTTNWI